MTDEPLWYQPGHHRVGIPRERRRGALAWTLRRGEEIMTCELLDDNERGAGIDVIVLKNDELLFSVRAANHDGARFAAESMKQDQLRQTGWSE